MGGAITRWGIVGTGFGAVQFTEGLARAPGASVVAVASRSEQRARAFAARHGIARAHEGLEAMAADREVDLVYLASHNTEHHAGAMAMLEAGKAVVCEKPFAMDAAQTREVVTLARRKRVFLMEAMWMRFVPAVRAAVAAIGAGEVGDPRSATIELGHPTKFDPSHRLFDVGLGGGALFDLGPYVVSLAVQLFGEPRQVDAHVVMGSSGVDEQVTALLGHANGRQAIVGVSLRSRLSNAASIAGTDGYLRICEPLYRPDAYSIERAPATSSTAAAATGRLRRARWVRDAYNVARAFIPRRHAGRIVRHPPQGNAYQYEAIEAMRCVRAGLLESPVMPLDDTVVVMETLDAIRRASRRP